MQVTLFGKLGILCRPFGPQAAKSQRAHKVQQEIENLGFRRNAAMILAHLIDYVTKEEWIEVC
jgi:hypothetical protein